MQQLPHSEADLNAYKNWESQKFDSAGMDLITRLTPVRDLIHQATLVKEVDWGWDYSKGKSLQIPELNGFRALSGAIALWIRAKFESKQSSAAIEGALDVLVLSRRLSDTPLIMTNLIARAIQDQTVSVVAAYLPSLTPAEGRQLTANLDALPVMHSLSDAVRKEMTTIDPRLQEVANEAARIASLAPSEAIVAGHSYPQKIAGVPEPLQGFVIKKPERLAFADAESRENLAMLSAAIQVKEHGPMVLSSCKDPVTSHPFTHRSVPGGFTLTGDALAGGAGDPTVLVVGPEALK